MDDNRLSVTDTSGMKGDCVTWSSNESEIESDSDSEYERNDIDKKDREREHSKTEREASGKVPKKSWSRIKNEKLIIAEVMEMNQGSLKRDKKIQLENWKKKVQNCTILRLCGNEVRTRVYYLLPIA